MSDSRRATGMTDRDKRMLVGFAFFAEILLGWFLLVDPLQTQLGKLQRDLAAAKEARDALRATMPASQDAQLTTGGDPLPPPLHAEGEEAAPLTVQRHVADIAARSGVTPVSVTVEVPAPELPASQRYAVVVVTGDYASIERFVGRLAWPDAREGVKRLDLKPEGPRGDRVRAEARMLVELSGR